ncbi:helix-turn-helix transcriptional regulator [Sporolactobacillus spathodeae]|uniref:Transcriptional regulator with XRE-family HTH domain n=1 Tax=Sporolactobacillus spathodeae TaxID=1465502 RepID=A0ABS2Q5B2_9BACL|nr:transcriptional regulator with XRE-family HTH domain [Sporolactobacillus spathodeae]
MILLLILNLKRLKKLRKAKMTLSEMSAKLGFKSQNGYYYLETGRNKISAEILAKVADILEVPIQNFFDDMPLKNENENK